MTQCNGKLRHSFNVTDFSTNRKVIYDFLFVINTNLPPILHRFQVMADFGQIFASESEVSHFNALAGVTPCQYHHK